MPTGWPGLDHSSLRLSFQVILDCVKLPVQTKHPNGKRIPRYFQIKQTCNLITLEVQIRGQPDLHTEFQASRMTLCLKKSVITLKKIHLSIHCRQKKWYSNVLICLKERLWEWKPVGLQLCLCLVWNSTGLNTSKETFDRVRYLSCFTNTHREKYFALCLDCQFF